MNEKEWEGKTYERSVVERRNKGQTRGRIKGKWQKNKKEKYIYIKQKNRAYERVGGRSNKGKA